MAKQGNLLSKTLVIGIIFLFIVMSIIPSIAVDNINIINSSGKSSDDDVDWWPMFRHDLHNSGYSTSDAPDTNNLLWSYKAGAAGSGIESSPAVVDGKVYIGTNDRNLYCLDAITGDFIWNYTTGSAVFSSPAVVDSKVYFGSLYHNVYCLDAITGAYIWSYYPRYELESSPAVADGKVYIGSYKSPYDYKGKVYCLDVNTGKYIWSFKTENWVRSSPAVADGKVYIGSFDRNVYCLDAITGDFIWSFDTGGWVWSSPAVVDGKVYIGTYDEKVYCLDAITGDFIWSYTTGDQVRPSPAVADGKVYFGSDDKVYCLDAITGAFIWSFNTGDWVCSSPAVADGKVYIGIYDGYVYCLDAITGDFIWSYETGDHIYSSPAVADGKVYIGSEDGNIYAFGELDPNAPSTPEINGSTVGVLDVMYNFTFKSESPVDNDLYYWIEWGDGSNSGWLGPYGSGVEITESHKWDTKENYPIQAKAKDINGSVSSWGIHWFNMLRSRTTTYSVFQLLIDRFPLLEVFLRAMNLLR